jgi:lipopolysaccharide transport system ATP-binding protein
MSDTVIRVENLAKKYVLSHSVEGQNYKKFSDVINNTAKSVVKALKPRGNNKIIPSNEEFWALKDVSFDIKQGDRVGIIGRNGAGKSTLLKILSRITEPTDGSIRIKGRVASLLEVGTGFHPELTGRENIFLNGAILGMSKAEIQRKFDEIVDFAEVEKFLDTPVKRYSSGMYVRLAFAVAAHLEPEILIVDEVLAVGDVQFQKKCIGKMEEVGKEGRTVLFVSHTMSTIERLCKSAILLRNGKVSTWGPVQDVVKAYLDEGATSSLCWSRSRPPKNSVYFQEIYLSDETGKIVEYVTTGTSLRIVLEYILESSCRNLFISLDLLDNKGELIFASNSQDVDMVPSDQPGQYRAIVTFPGEILLANTYMIRANLWSHDEGTLDSVDNFRFTVVEVASSSNAKYRGKPGKLFILCNWLIQEKTRFS